MKEIILKNKTRSIWEGEKETREGISKELGEIPHNKQVGMINYLFSNIDFDEKKKLVSELEKNDKDILNKIKKNSQKKMES